MQMECCISNWRANCQRRSNRVALKSGRLARRGLPPDEVEKRLAAQMTQREKMERADRVLFNSGGMDVLREQTRRVWETLMEQQQKGGKHE